MVAPKAPDTTGVAAKVTGWLVFFFSIAILTRIMTNRNSPGLIKNFADALSALFYNTIH